MSPSASSVEAAVGGSMKGLGPKIQFATTVFDFGKVVGGEVIKHEFIFTNVGTQLLLVKDVQSTCGCTSAAHMTRQVEPGKKGSIPIEFHTANFSGAIAKTITVICNDASQANVTLQLKGSIWRPIEVIPPNAVLTGLLDSPSNSFAVLRILNKQDEPLILGQPVSNNRMITAELQTNQPGKEYQLIVKLVPPLNSGNVFGQITLKTSTTNMPVLNISAWAVAQPMVLALPAQLELPAGPLANCLTQSVSIRSIWASPLSLSEPVLNAAGVNVRVYELQPGRFFTLQLTFPKGFQIAPDEKLQLSVKSNHPQYPLLKVPITQSSPTFSRRER